MAETSEDIALQSREILQTFVWWGGGGTNLPPTIQTSWQHDWQHECRWIFANWSM